MHKPKPGVWRPMFDLDFEVATAKQFAAFKAKYLDFFATLPEPGPLSVETGWNTITPEMIERDLLRRNVSNRKTVFTAIQSYARSMVADDWQPTGQPLLFDEA